MSWDSLGQRWPRFASLTQNTALCWMQMAEGSVIMPEKYKYPINICVQYGKEAAGVLEDAGVLPNLLGTEEAAKH